MLNKVTLTGVIRDITESHNIGDIKYNKANMIVNRPDGKADILTIKFKSLSNPYKEDTTISLIGNMRSYTTHADNRNQVELYLFTYFDQPDDTDVANRVELVGTVCSKDKLRVSYAGKHSIRFTLANNLKDGDKYKFDNYIPCVIYGAEAKRFEELVNVKDTISIIGEFHSREYKKYTDNDMTLGVAHEVSVSEYIICKCVICND